MSHDSSTTEQDSPLLKLPGELKNRILELVMPTNTTIFMRAETTHPVDGLGYNFHPAPPAVLATCRGLRADALSLYYASNTFLLPDTMLQPKALKGFAAARGAALDALRSMKVVHYYAVLKPYRETDGKLREVELFYGMVFTLTARRQGLALSMVHSHQRVARAEWDTLAAPGDGLCYCSLEAMAAECGEYGAQGSKDLIAVLCRYVELVNEYQKLVRIKRNRGGKNVVAKLCEHCNKVKSI